MGTDDRKSVAPISVGPVSVSPETEVLDASWDDEEHVELEILAPEDAAAGQVDLEESCERPTPFLGDELALESGFHERESPTEPTDDFSPPRVPVFDPRALPDELAAEGTFSAESGPPDIELPHVRPFASGARRPPSAELDDPLAHLELDLDTETPSGEHGPIEERVTPVQAAPDSLLELHREVSTAPAPEADPAARDMRERYAVGDFTGALVIAESILEADPEDLDAKRYAQSCREVLMQMYSARLGALTQVVNIAIPSDQIRWLSLDHRAGFLLSLVDGASSVEELLDICGMPRLDALRILYQLLEQRVIALAQG
jgi:hypothetical protein